MFDPTIIQMGPLFLPLILVVTAILLFTSVWIAERISPAKERVKRKVSEWLPTALLIGLVVYKFGPALLDLKHVLQHPAMLLYVSGNSISTVMAALIAGGWLAWKAVKHPHSWEVADTIAVAGLFTLFGYNVVFKDLGEATSMWWGWGETHYRYHPLNMYRLLLLLPLVIGVLRMWGRLDRGQVFSLVVLWIGAIYTFVSFFDYHPGSLYFGLTGKQWTAVLFALIGWGLRIYMEKKKQTS